MHFDAISFALIFAALCIGLIFFLSGIARAAADSPEKKYHDRTLPEWREFVKSQPLPALGTDEIVRGLMAIVADPAAPWEDRRQFALTLGRIGAPAVAAVPVFRQLLSNQESDPLATQLWSLKALGLMGRPAAGASGDVLPIVTDPRSPFLIRSTAMETLARIGPENAATLPALIGVLASDRNSPDPQSANELRRSAAEAISLLGPDASPAIPELLRALQSDWPLLQQSAATALGSLGARGEPAIVPLADVVLFDTSGAVREAAADALGAIGRPALSALEALMVDEETIVRSLAVRGLQRSNVGAAAVELLRRKLADESPVIRVEAAAAILRYQPDSISLQVLVTGLRDRDREARIKAYRSLRTHIGQLAPYREELENIESNPELNSQSRLAARRLLGLIEL